MKTSAKIFLTISAALALALAAGQLGWLSNRYSLDLHFALSLSAAIFLTEHADFRISTAIKRVISIVSMACFLPVFEALFGLHNFPELHRSGVWLAAIGYGLPLAVFWGYRFMPKSTTSKQNPTTFISIEEYAERYRIPKTEVQAHIQSGKLASHSSGSQIFVANHAPSAG